jgi:nicotinamidase-related amidase
MENNTEKHISRRALLHRVGAFAGASSTHHALMGASQFSNPTKQSKGEHNGSKKEFSLIIPTWYYQQFDADYTLDVPEEGFGGWKKTNLEFSGAHIAVVVMHAWDMGTREKFPGWWRAVPYAPRSQTILRTVFPHILKTVRHSEIPMFHVVGGGNKYWKNFPGYKRAASLAGPDTKALEQVASDPFRDKLAAFRQKHCFVGQHNRKDVERGFEQLDFAEQARPTSNEGVAENSRQLFALCKERGVNHLVYCGFAINWCLLLSPGGMAEMSKYGLWCSVIRQATTSVENKETARNELCKEIALWRVALAFGFVFDVNDFISAIKK